MSKFKNVTGTLLIEVKTAYTERFLNLCSSENVHIISVSYIELGVISVKIKLSDLKKIQKIAKDDKYSYIIKKKHGLPFKMFDKRKRFGLFIGLIFIGITYFEISSRLVGIEINGTSDQARIFNILSSESIHLGMKIDEIRTRELPLEIIMSNDDIHWIALNVKGNSLTVEVKMREDVPEIFDRTKTSDIIAEKSGVIDSIDVRYGEQIFNVGESFLEGDVLVSANVSHYPNMESYNPLFVQSYADIYAKIIYEFDRVLPQNLSSKNYTGREKTDYSIIFQKKSYNLFENSGNYYEFYDKMVVVKTFDISKYITFPFSLQIEKYSEYEPFETTINENYEVLLKNSKKHVVNNNECAVLVENFAKTSNLDFLRIHYKCETLEKIGILTQR